MVDNVFERAVDFANKAHAGMFRKGTKIPYIIHPLEVATIVYLILEERGRDFNEKDYELMATAVLHDTVEDTENTADDIEREFGARVRELVAAESENKREELPAQDTWRIRKQETLEHLKKASEDVKIITFADKLSNLRAISRDEKILGDEIWKRFNQKDPAEHKWYYLGVLENMEFLKDSPLYAEYVKLIEETFEK